MLRELLVIFRIWGLIRQSCLPAFCYMENIDVIATLFRILTRLLQTPEPDDALLGNLIVFYFSLPSPGRRSRYEATASRPPTRRGRIDGRRFHPSSR